MSRSDDQLAHLAHLARLDRCKRADQTVGEALGVQLVELYHRQVERRQTKLGQIADAWGRLVPESLQERSCLEGLHRGRLTVVVDSAPHLFQLRQLLLAGLEKQLLAACRGAGVRRIALKRGRWYDQAGNPAF